VILVGDCIPLQAAAIIHVIQTAGTLVALFWANTSVILQLCMVI